jgi:small subunit ribosomal protein S8
MNKVSDFIIRIKNAVLARRKKVTLSYSKQNLAIGKVLVNEQFLEDIKEEVEKGRKVLTATIRYIQRSPVITDVKIISKPSLRRYVRSQVLGKNERRNMSTIILTTSKGVMTGRDAKKQGIGGEALFEVW